MRPAKKISKRAGVGNRWIVCADIFGGNNRHEKIINFEGNVLYTLGRHMVAARSGNWEYTIKLINMNLRKRLVALAR